MEPEPLLRIARALSTGTASNLGRTPQEDHKTAINRTCPPKVESLKRTQPPSCGPNSSCRARQRPGDRKPDHHPRPSRSLRRHQLQRYPEYPGKSRNPGIRNRSPEDPGYGSQSNPRYPTSPRQRRQRPSISPEEKLNRCQTTDTRAPASSREPGLSSSRYTTAAPAPPAQKPAWSSHLSA